MGLHLCGSFFFQGLLGASQRQVGQIKLPGGAIQLPGGCFEFQFTPLAFLDGVGALKKLLAFCLQGLYRCCFYFQPLAQHVQPPGQVFDLAGQLAIFLARQLQGAAGLCGLLALAFPLFLLLFQLGKELGSPFQAEAIAIRLQELVELGGALVESGLHFLGLALLRTEALAEYAQFGSQVFEAVVRFLPGSFLEV